MVAHLFFLLTLLSKFYAFNQAVCSSHCPQDWKESPTTGNCYRLVEEELNWAGARARCNSLAGEKHGDLVSINSEEEQKFIELLLWERRYKWAWIGFTDEVEENHWKWSDESPAIYTNWRSTDPNNGNAYWVENCGEIRPDNAEFQWNDRDCNVQNPAAVCEMKVTTSTATTYACEYPWIKDPATGNCYIVVQNELNWFDARDECNSLAGKDQADLASIHSSAETTFIKDILDKLPTKHYWMGLNDIMKEGEFVWTDGTSVDYTDWKSSVEPNDSKNYGGEDCGCLWNSRKWNDCNCTYWKIPFVCKKI